MASSSHLRNARSSLYFAIDSHSLALYFSIGVPHTSTQSDQYLGYHIPKGSLVMANIWSVPLLRHQFVIDSVLIKILLRQMARNPEIYDDPKSFCPERFINAKPLDPRQMVFGFGRR